MEFAIYAAMLCSLSATAPQVFTALNRPVLHVSAALLVITVPLQGMYLHCHVLTTNGALKIPKYLWIAVLEPYAPLRELLPYWDP